MSGYGYNYDNDGGQGGQYHDGMNDPYNQSQQYEYGYHDPYSNAMGDYGDGSEGADYGYGEPGDDNGVAVSGGDVGEGDDGSSVSDAVDDEIDFDDPRIANLPRILLMGPRRAGKTSIQRVVFHKMSPHETLFRLEATQNLERSVVDHTPLCRFTIWDFPGDYYGHENSHDMTDGGINNHAQSPNSRLPMMRQPPVHAINNDPTLIRDHNNTLDLDDRNKLPHTVTTGSNALAQSSDDVNAGEDDGDAQVFGRATALIFVLDAQDEPYDHVLQHFTETVKRAARANPHIAIEVFINKVDGELFLSDEAKYDCRRDVMQQVSDELADAGVMPDSVQISYHLTSIYDHSVFEAFSRVVQKLIPQLPTLENLLNVLVSTCAMEKAFLFDVASKLYISTDSSPVDMQSVELCSDMIDVVLDVSGIYGLTGGNDDDDDDDGDGNKLESADVDSSIPGGEILSLNSGDPSKITAGLDADVSNVAGDDNTNISSVPIDYGDGNDELVGTLISQGADALAESAAKEPDTDNAYDSESVSVIRLSKGMVLYLKEVDTMLALVCLTRSDNFRKRNLINYNIGCLKKALRALVSPNS